jgi:hypothetical protein
MPIAGVSRDRGLVRFVVLQYYLNAGVHLRGRSHMACRSRTRSVELNVDTAVVHCNCSHGTRSLELATQSR